MIKNTIQKKNLVDIEKALKEKGLSITNQRRMIIAEILRGGSHFDIESLAARMYSKYGQTARATIYRTVKILADVGIIKREMLGENHSHYEFIEQDHGHFVCSSCGKIIELSCPTLENFLASTSKSHDFTVERHSIEIFGVCGDCIRKQRKDSVI